MLTREKQALAMSAVRDQLLAALAQHEQEDHGGAPCVGNRLSAVAFLAHCLGMEDEHLNYFEHLLNDYNRDCPTRNCAHTKESKHGEESSDRT